jgi:hypothetical protein
MGLALSSKWHWMGRQARPWRAWLAALAPSWQEQGTSSRQLVARKRRDRECLLTSGSHYYWTSNIGVIDNISRLSPVSADLKESGTRVAADLHVSAGDCCCVANMMTVPLLCLFCPNERKRTRGKSMQTLEVAITREDCARCGRIPFIWAGGHLAVKRDDTLFVLQFHKYMGCTPPL